MYREIFRVKIYNFYKKTDNFSSIQNTGACIVDTEVWANEKWEKTGKKLSNK